MEEATKEAMILQQSERLLALRRKLSGVTRLLKEERDVSKKLREELGQATRRIYEMQKLVAER